MTSFYLGLLCVSALTGLALAGFRAREGRRLIVAGFESLLALVIARALLPADELSAWGWTAAVGVYAALLGLVAHRWRQIPLLHSSTTRVGIVASGIWLLIMLTAVVALLSTFV